MTEEGSGRIHPAVQQPKGEESKLEHGKDFFGVEKESDVGIEGLE